VEATAQLQVKTGTGGARSLGAQVAAHDRGSEGKGGVGARRTAAEGENGAAEQPAQRGECQRRWGCCG